MCTKTAPDLLTITVNVIFFKFAVQGNKQKVEVKGPGTSHVF